MIVNVFDARNNLSRLIKQMHAGEEIVIANRGQPVARLIPADHQQTEKQSISNLLDWLDDDPLPRHLQRTAEEIDAAIMAEREGWD